LRKSVRQSARASHPSHVAAFDSPFAKGDGTRVILIELSDASSSAFDVERTVDLLEDILDVLFGQRRGLGLSVIKIRLVLPLQVGLEYAQENLTELSRVGTCWRGDWLDGVGKVEVDEREDDLCTPADPESTGQTDR
jgi:hypothetical protein